MLTFSVTHVADHDLEDIMSQFEAALHKRNLSYNLVPIVDYRELNPSDVSYLNDVSVDYINLPFNDGQLFP